MLTIKTIRLLQFITYMVVTSQVLFYLLILADSLKVISLSNFFELRKTVDALMIGRFKAMYYACLACCLVAVIVSARQPTSVFFISSVLSFVLLIIDFVIIIKYSMPLNSLSHQYAVSNESVNWEQVRLQWLYYMKLRGVFITAGMVSLISGLLFERG